jgi:dTDP-4-amino-4,6-dideoxygalactose transaminase
MIPVMIPQLGEEEAQAAAEAIRSGWVAQGPRVARFEQEFAAAVGAGHGVAVSSCTTGLHLALVLLDIKPGDEVVVPSLSFIATANAVRYVGATPVFADVDLATGNVTVETVDAVRTERTRAIIAVHQGGVPFDTAALRKAADGWGVGLVEDAACAAGSTVYGQPAGAGAKVAAWSFHPRKLITTGEGGMVTVDFQAAVGLVQLERLAGLVAQRRAFAARYQELLAGIEGLVPVRDPAYGQTNYQSFWVLLDGFPVSRDEVLTELAAKGVSARRGIMAAHLEPAYADMADVSLPVTERITRESLILPLHHKLTEDDQDHIVGVLRDLAGR